MDKLYQGRKGANSIGGNGMDVETVGINVELRTFVVVLFRSILEYNGKMA